MEKTYQIGHRFRGPRYAAGVCRTAAEDGPRGPACEIFERVTPYARLELELAGYAEEMRELYQAAFVS